LVFRVLPKKALKDFSVSLLLCSSIDNVSSFTHRGILYAQLERYIPLDKITYSKINRMFVL